MKRVSEVRRVGWVKRKMKQMLFLSWGNVNSELGKEAVVVGTGLTSVYVGVCVCSLRVIAKWRGGWMSQYHISCALIKKRVGYTVLILKCHIKQTPSSGW